MAEWSPFGKELLARLNLHVCSLCIIFICNLSYFPFWFEGVILVLIVPVSFHCFLVAFAVYNLKHVS